MACLHATTLGLYVYAIGGNIELCTVCAVQRSFETRLADRVVKAYSNQVGLMEVEFAARVTIYVIQSVLEIAMALCCPRPHIGKNNYASF
jgi:hypothetical protein